MFMDSLFIVDLIRSITACRAIKDSRNFPSYAKCRQNTFYFRIVLLLSGCVAFILMSLFANQLNCLVKAPKGIDCSNNTQLANITANLIIMPVADYTSFPGQVISWYIWIVVSIVGVVIVGLIDYHWTQTVSLCNKIT